jgi:CxxC-x17-CxxC domain-containing protein
MKEFKKGHRKGTYNPLPFKKGPRAGFGSAAKRESGPLEMHQATCVACHKFCEVPFKPNGKKPVFCRDCFATQESGATTRQYASKPAYAERTVVRSSIVPRQDDLRSEVQALTIKIDTLTRMVAALGDTPARKAVK